MVKYIETQYGERATAGDIDQIDALVQKIAKLEEKLEVQKARK